MQTLHLKSLDDTDIHDLYKQAWLETHPHPETLRLTPLAYVVSDGGRIPEGLLVETHAGNLRVWDRRCLKSVSASAARKALNKLTESARSI